MKKMHSLLRAMVAFALCCSMLTGAAIAAGTAKGESGIMPLASLYTDRAYSEKSGAWQSVKFTATSGSGDYDEPLTPDELAAQSPMNCQYLFSTAEGTYALTFASDIQYDVSSPSQTEEYKRLKEGIPQIQYLLSMNES